MRGALGVLEPANLHQIRVDAKGRKQKSRSPKPEMNKNLQFSSVIVDYFQHFRFYRLSVLVSVHSKAAV